MSTIASRKVPTANTRPRKRADSVSAAQQRNARQRSYNWRRRLMLARRFMVVLMLGAATYGGWFVWQQGYAAQIGMITDAMLLEVPTIPTLRVARVDITGNDHVSRQDIQSTIGDLSGMPILRVPLDTVRDNILQMGWVRDVSILRSLPGTIRISIKEREPYAVWQHDGVLRLIDRDGVEIERQGLQAYTHLPLIVGDGAPRHVAGLLEALRQQPSIWPRVHALVRVGDRRWDLQFKNGIEVMLPEEGAGEAWARLARLEQQHAILSRDVAVLDLRLADRLTVRPARENGLVRKTSNKRI